MTQQANVPPPPPPWHVVSQQEGTQPGPAGTYTKGVTVYFVTDTGTTGSVFVPNAQYSAATVQAAINARVAALLSVDSLTG